MSRRRGVPSHWSSAAGSLATPAASGHGRSGPGPEEHLELKAVARRAETGTTRSSSVRRSRGTSRARRPREPAPRLRRGPGRIDDRGPVQTRPRIRSCPRVRRRFKAAIANPVRHGVGYVMIPIRRGLRQPPSAARGRDCGPARARFQAGQGAATPLEKWRMFAVQPDAPALPARKRGWRGSARVLTPRGGLRRWRRARARAPPVGMAVVGAGYWGPNLVRNFWRPRATDLRWVCDLDVERARRVAGRKRRPGHADLDDVLADRRWRRSPIATPRHARRVALALHRGGQARARREAARRLLRRRAADGRGGRGARRRPHVRPHVLLHAGGPTHPRAGARRRARATPVLSTRCASTSAWSSPTSTCSGTWRRTTCRSSTSCSPAGRRPGRGRRARRRPARDRARLRRLPDPAAQRRRASRTSTSTG